MFKHNHLEHTFRHARGATLVALSGLAGWAAAADVTAPPATVILTDTPASFLANCDFTTTEGDAPANGLDGSAKVAVVGANWTFKIWHVVSGLAGPPVVPPWGVAGATTLQVCIDGKHLHGPHPPPWVPADIDPNLLPQVCTLKPGGVAPYAVPFFLTASNNVKHPTTGGPHEDTYTLEAGCTAMAGAPPSITGKAVVSAKHKGKSTQKSERKKKGKGSKNSFIFYDAATQMLFIQPGPIDVLDSVGALSGIIEPDYLNDPVLQQHLEVTPLHFLGVSPDGRYRFSGGQVSLGDPAGSIALTGSFPEYLIGDTSRVAVLDSYGLMEQVSTVVQAFPGEPLQPVSKFLYDFSQTDLLGHNMPEAEWLDIMGVDLAFVTPINLAVMTQGFTQSAGSPAMVMIACNGRWLDCPADLNGDGSVGIVDFLSLLGSWGMNADGPPDINGDEFVGIVDLLQLLGSWGPC